MPTTPLPPPLSVRLTEDVLSALDRVAAREERTRTHQIRRYIREGLARDGIDLAAQPAGGAE